MAKGPCRIVPKRICPKCGAKISTNNFLRHWRVHRTIDPQPASTLPVPVSMVTQQQTSTPSSSVEPPVEAGAMSLAATSAATSQSSSVDSLSTQYVKAARALLKRTDQYTEGNLMAFLAAKYPDIPEVNRQALVIGATTGAQTAAQLHVLVEGTKTCRDTASRVMAQGAQRCLAYWNLGLMSEDPDDPNPQIEVSPSELTPVCPDNPARMVMSAGGVHQQVAVPRRERSDDREEEPSDDVEENDMELSSPSVELVDEILPGTQPCSHETQDPRKRSRSPSPCRGRKRDILPCESTAYPPLDQWIQCELQQPQSEGSTTEYHRGRDHESPEIDPPPSTSCELSQPPAKRVTPSRDIPSHVSRSVATAAAVTYHPTPTTQPATRDTAQSGKVYSKTAVKIWRLSPRYLEGWSPHGSFQRQQSTGGRLITGSSPLVVSTQLERSRHRNRPSQVPARYAS